MSHSGRIEPDEAGSTFSDNPFAPVGTVVPSLRRLLIVRGVLATIAGIAILFLLVWRPVGTLTAFGILAGAFFVAIGVIRLITGIVAAGMGGGVRALNIVFGVLVALIGFVAVVNPGIGLMTIAIMVGVAWVFEGVAALSTMPESHRGVWIMFAIVSLLAGLVIVALPWVSAAPLIIVTGICLVVFGILDIANGIRLSKMR
ncbi:MAG: DUF308 domain-containing protein [Bifidobacteriaceae bacterium]|nr:DUF308 domain-containing protein [Bifidobacteriaceae bacterium]